MSDLRYIVVCNNSIRDDVTYHSSEPEKMDKYMSGSYSGGFSYRISDAIVHTNIMLAHLERKRMAKMYPSYTMKVKTISAKKLFKAKLAG